MCRFIAYVGNPIILDDVLYKPKYSLIKQSYRARETDITLNGDGFGIGWYASQIDHYPALFSSIQPAWNDQNLRYLAPKIRSNCFFAHVRAASTGEVSLANNHPFHYKRLLFMHNGDIAEFGRIKRYLRRQLSDETYDWIRGQTDSEHMFALFIDIFKKHHFHFTAEEMAAALVETIHTIKAIQKKHHIKGVNYINAALTDGRSIVAIRYISSEPKRSPSMHFSEGRQYLYHNSKCRMLPTPKGEENGAVLVVSEKLDSDRAEWQNIPVNHILLVRDNLSTALKAIKA